ncbi:MAG: 1-deoxy-D-xylulose-5-phosphate synthase [Firmicutes bacterium]|nr:1-deoxy-D-xylulose-5-phosphate synthase [Bacillota bacterium]
MSFLDNIKSPEDFKKVSVKDYPELATDVRAKIKEAVGTYGGHLASNLGIVEATIALHKAFDLSQDKIIWDVGHQCYTHKLLTGRALDGLRHNGGVSGFPKPSESQFDCMTSGHSSTSLSSALGLARARDLRGDKNHIVAVIGDGALSGGMVFEALNDFGSSKTKAIIVLNDNKMSIAKNVGALSTYLSHLRASGRYRNFKRNIKKAVSALPFFGDTMIYWTQKAKDRVVGALWPSNVFESYGFKYFGPFDGHNTEELIATFSRAKKINTPVLIHIITQKGRGDADAMLRPDEYHGVSPKTNKKAVSYEFGAALGETLSELAGEDKRVVAVTAAMEQGTGLTDFASRYPKRFFDVGIAEQHAVTLCAGLATGGMRPYFAVYSTFLQRAYDQVMHDVCIAKLPVTFCIDRAGAIGADGVTHQGIYDIAYLSQIPNMTILAPRDLSELKAMLKWSINFDGPLAIRYPRNTKLEASGTGQPNGFVGSWVIERKEVSKNGGEKYIVAVGSRMIEQAMGTKGATIVNARSVKPLDTKFLSSLKDNDLLITMEDGVVRGGFGSAVREYYSATKSSQKIITLGYEDSFLDDYDVSSSLKSAGLNSDSVQKLLDECDQM